MKSPAAMSLLLLVPFALVSCDGVGGSIEYRGEHIKLRRWYISYDDYKNDPENLHASEVSRVQELVRTAPVRKGCGSWGEMAQSALEVTFPGYGSGSLKSEWARLRAFSIEVPQAEQERVFVFRLQSDKWCLVDDFMLDGPMPRQVVESEGALVLSDSRGRELAKRGANGAK
jgi:hypothetical protein